MAYIVLTEAEASAAETVLEGLERMKAVLEANRPILRAGGRTVGERSILISAQSAIAQFPAIQIEPTKLLEVPATLGGSSGQNRVRATYRLYLYDLALGRGEELTRQLAQLTDRVQAVLRRNRTLDGFCLDLWVERVIYGRLRGGPRTVNPIFAPHPIFASQIDATIERWIERG
ncbi:MAG: hypothetical protein KatS3mg115_1381 [Candidatus Poribacteria bacterium]|nr:MAG: hypothetical protein KatS3mg115_1381 [Candidatus Poribacteria bacterium]